MQIRLHLLFVAAGLVASVCSFHSVRLAHLTCESLKICCEVQGKMLDDWMPALWCSPEICPFLHSGRRAGSWLNPGLKGEAAGLTLTSVAAETTTVNKQMHHQTLPVFVDLVSVAKFVLELQRAKEADLLHNVC